MGLEAKVSSEYTVGGGDWDVMNKEASWGRPKAKQMSPPHINKWLCYGFCS